MPKWILLLLLIFLVGCSMGNEEETTATENEETSVPVHVEEIQEASLTDRVEVTGTVAADHHASIIPVSGGEIEAVEVSNGDEVEAGDVLVRMDTSEVDLNVEQARSQLQSAEASLESAKNARQSAIRQAEHQLEQAESAYDFAKEMDETMSEDNDTDTDVPEEMQEIFDSIQGQNELEEANQEFELEQAEQAVRSAELALEDAQSTDQIETAEASVEQAEIGLQLAQEQVEHFTVQAPISGQVTDLMAQEGQMASAQNPLMNIIALDPLHVSAAVSAEQLAQLSEGQEVDVHINALGQSLEGEIRYISPSPTEESRQYPVEVVLDETPEDLRPGMVAQIVRTEESEETYMMVPIDAVLSEGGTSFVYVTEGDRAVQREVTTGEPQDEYIVIEDGLDKEDQIVVQGQLRLTDEALIDIQDEAEESE